MLEMAWDKGEINVYYLTYQYPISNSFFAYPVCYDSMSYSQKQQAEQDKIEKINEKYDERIKKLDVILAYRSNNHGTIDKIHLRQSTRRRRRLL